MINTRVFCFIRTLQPDPALARHGIGGCREYRNFEARTFEDAKAMLRQTERQPEEWLYIGSHHAL